MAGPLWFDRVRETSSTSGTGAITPSGAFDTSFQAIGAVLAASDTAYFTVRDDAGAWNTFLGTWNGTTVTRTTILAGSSGVSAVNLSGTGVEIWIDAPADWISSRARMGDLPKATQTGNYTLVAADRGTIVEFTGSAASTITLPSAATVGAGWSMILKHAGTGTTAATKKLAISGTLDGVSNPAVYPGDTRIIQSDGSNLTSILLVGGYLEIQSTDSPFTLTLPTAAAWLQFEAWGGGGSGGSGRRGAAGTTRIGGSAGGGGAYNPLTTTLADLAVTSLTCTVAGAAVAGAAISVDDTNGAHGAAGENTTVGAVLTGYGGGRGGGGQVALTNIGGGGGGTTAAGGNGGGSSSVAGGGNPTAGSIGAFCGGGSSLTFAYPSGVGGGAGGACGSGGTSVAGGCATLGGSGGGGGGGVTAANSGSAGQAGGSAIGANGGGGARGLSAGQSGTDGDAGPTPTGHGTGGGGGAGSDTAANLAGGNGGNGGIACGGGGGGASHNGYNSGAGGSGGAGLIRFRYGP